MQQSISQIHKEFLTFETRENLAGLLVGGHRVWPDIRLPVYLRILEKSGGFDRFIEQPAKSKLRWLLRALPGFIFRNPNRRLKNTDLLFWSNPRRILQPDNLYWDIYTDPVIDFLSEKYEIVSIEDNFDGRHLKPAKTKRLMYADFLTAIAYLRKRNKHILLERPEAETLDGIERNLRRLFDVDVDLKSLVTNNLRNKRAYLPLYRKLLKRHSPKAVVIICSYGKETLIEACKLEGVPVAEIQHGIIGPGHAGYSFARIGDKPNFPDYLFTFGEYWKQNVRFPIEDRYVIPLGFPFLSIAAEGSRNGKRNTILFISQGTIGTALSEFAVELRKLIPAAYNIMYKLHPNETRGWRERYPNLSDSGITVVDTDSPSLYTLMGESKWLFGVYSTAIYEGLYFNCSVFIVRLPGYEHLLPLVESGAATLIGEPGEFSVHAKAKEYDRNGFFDSRWRSNLEGGIDRMIHRN